MFNDIYKNKKVLVTGHTGFKGSWLCLWLQSMGAKVYGLSNHILPFENHFSSAKIDEIIESHFCDVRNYNDVIKIFKTVQPDIIFHLAAEAIVKSCYSDPKRAFDTNVGGTLNILEAIRHTDSVKSAVIITSDKCYENVEWEYGYRENDRLGGKDPYSASKACAELVFYSYFHSFHSHNTNLNIATARAGNVIGGGDWAPDRIVPDCIRSWIKKESVEIRSPYATRPWQTVFEPLSGYLWLASQLYTKVLSLNGESFNFGPKTNDEYTVEELIKVMQKNWDHVSYHINAPEGSNIKECGRLKLSCEKAKSRLNWEATLTFDETVLMTTDWYRRFYSGMSAYEVQKMSLDQINLYCNYAKERSLSWAIN
jgi:CDP-glucose 4,6-dehydratase